jgi:steroid 5-alpha reductase family enzyme
MKETTKGYIALFIVYLLSIAAAYYATTVFVMQPFFQITALATLTAVTVVFIFSVIFNNSSIFDPYWSVAPVVVAVYYMLLVQGHWTVVSGEAVEIPRLFVVLVLVLIWGIRLTWNFLRGWKGLKHEDWRYVDFRAKTGKLYWPVSFVGIHFFPAVMVFLGCLSVWVIFLHGTHPMNLLDVAGGIVTILAISLETIADRQLRSFNKANPGSRKTLASGLWSVVRHPNYLGEILFWWGIYLFAIASNPSFWKVIIGPVIITLMFVFISIPMIEKRMVARRQDYETYKKKVPRLIPFVGGKK